MNIAVTTFRQQYILFPEEVLLCIIYFEQCPVLSTGTPIYRLIQDRMVEKQVIARPTRHCSQPMTKVGVESSSQIQMSNIFIFLCDDLNKLFPNFRQMQLISVFSWIGKIASRLYNLTNEWQMRKHAGIYNWRWRWTSPPIHGKYTNQYRLCICIGYDESTTIIPETRTGGGGISCTDMVIPEKSWNTWKTCN